MALTFIKIDVIMNSESDSPVATTHNQPRGLKMNIYKPVLLSLMLASLVACSTSSSTELTPLKQGFSIIIEPVGASSFEGVIRPIYMLAVNDPNPNERMSIRDSRFNTFAVDGTIFTPYLGDWSRWFGVYWRKPRGLDQEREFWIEQKNGVHAKQSRFYHAGTPGSPSDILPAPFNRLSAEDLSIVTFVTLYKDGSMRVGLKEGEVTARQATDLASSTTLMYEWLPRPASSTFSRKSVRNTRNNNEGCSRIPRTHFNSLKYPHTSMGRLCLWASPLRSDYDS